MAARQTPKPTADELEPINWPAIYPLYKAGVPSLRVIAAKFGTSHVTISKHAKTHGWGERDQKPAVLERAEQLVTSATASSPVTAKARIPENTLTEEQTIEVTAQVIATVRLEHRRDVRMLRERCLRMVEQLAAADEEPELFAKVREALLATGELTGEQRGDMADMVTLVASLPARAKVLKDLADVYFKLVGMEREAYGLNTDNGADGRPMVIIKDFTGRGDHDSLRNTGAAA